MSIQETIQAAAAGDRRAFAAIVEQYRQMVWRVALRMLGNPDEAEDAVQETFIRAWKALPGFDRRYSPATWLGTIAVRRVIQTLSPMQRTAFVLHEIEQLPFEEVRRATGWSAVQLKSNLYLARQKVRKALEKEKRIVNRKIPQLWTNTDNS